MRRALYALPLLPALVLAALSAQPQSPTAVLLYPPDGCVITASRVQVMCVAPRWMKDPGVRLNGRPVRLTRTEPAEGWYPRAIRRGASARPALLETPHEAAIWHGTVAVPPGKHVLAIGAKPTRFERAASGKATRQRVLAAHPPVGTHPCGGCHPMGASATILGEPAVPEVCQGCHPAARLQTIHKHIMDPLKRCWTCHDPHGSTRPHLLTDTKDRLCSRCHALGHTKP